MQLGNIIEYIVTLVREVEKCALKQKEDKEIYKFLVEKLNSNIDFHLEN